MENIIYDYLLKNCRGKENALKGSVIRKILNIQKSDKAFRGYIQNINSNKNFKHLVGAVSGKGQNAGYFIPITKKEKEEVINNRRHRANAMLRECYIMRWKKCL